jgi:CPA1 family monovalent cation:H+ antiporter
MPVQSFSFLPGEKIYNFAVMELFHVISAILALSAIFSYLNSRFLRMPSGIFLMLAGMGFSLIVLIIGGFSPEFSESVKQTISKLDFADAFLNIMLSFMLFAGAMHVNLSILSKVKWSILSFATVGVLVSTILVGSGFHLLLNILGISLPYIHCLLFGALISPTDPIAVMGILKKAGVSEVLGAKIAGESLFNDGVGVVIFLTIYQIAELGLGQVGGEEVGMLLLKEIGGGLALGLGLGYLAFFMMKRIDNYVTEVLISLALVMGGYSLAQLLHFSGPLAMVVAGLLIGNQGHRYAMSDLTADYVHKFWEMTDEVLNAVLFVFIGLEILIIPFSPSKIFIGLLCAILVPTARYLSLATPAYLLGLKRTFEPNTLSIMTWGGLKGGISIALALSLTAAMDREIILPITYVVVLISLGFQGLTVGKLVERLKKV